jgi:hypothetical protein
VRQATVRRINVIRESLAARVSFREVRPQASWEVVMSWTNRISRVRQRFLALATLAILAGGCLATHPTFTAQGTGIGTSNAFQVEAGSYGIAWTADDNAPPADGCLFGLLIDPVGPAPNDSADQSSYSLPKLAYQVLEAGGLLHGRETLELRAGAYQFVVEGSCGWNLSIDGPVP